mgnify:CR=1 FL=1
MAKTLKICGTTCTVEYGDPGAWASNGMGRTSEVEAKIYLRSGMPKDVARATLLHEIIHMIACMNDLGDIATNETVVSVLAHGLNGIISEYDLRDGFQEE